MGNINQVKRLSTAFPTLPEGFYDILLERIKENGFSDQRFQDAVSNLIDTCPYPQPTIANIISWDKKIKLYTYCEVVEKVNEGHSMHDFQKMEGKKTWIKVTDAKLLP